MEYYSMILLTITFFAFLHCQRTEARHNQLLCNRWKTNCDKYETHCNQQERNENSTNSTDQLTTGGPNVHKTKIWADCCSLAQSTNSSAPSGVYNIESPFGSFTQMQAHCDLDGGWTVIQRRRINGTQDFNKGWHEYLDGFGSLDGDFWYGLNKIRWLTSKNNTYELKVDITTIIGETKTAEYSPFSVKGDLFKLSLGNLKGEEDFLGPYKGLNFTTIDLNNSGGINCAELDATGLLSGWWYEKNTCFGDGGINLNGKFLAKDEKDRNLRELINSTEMKIRPVGCTIPTNISQGSSSVQ